MTIQNMHYDFKKKLNKVDSQKYKNLLVPEIDWVLNEAYELFVKLVASPRLNKQIGFEKTQRSIDEIRVLVKENCIEPVSKVATLPNDYWMYVNSYVLMNQGGCPNVKGKIFIRQHDDDIEGSVFDESSFEWRTVNATFYETGVKFYTNDEFIIESFCLSYIRKLEYIHNAAAFQGGSYNLPDSTNLTSTVNCPLPDSTHREIVDLAVMITTGELENSNAYQINQAKLNLNQLN
jgi:hypothetical protein